MASSTPRPPNRGSTGTLPAFSLTTICGVRRGSRLSSFSLPTLLQVHEPGNEHEHQARVCKAGPSGRPSAGGQRGGKGTRFLPAGLGGPPAGLGEGAGTWAGMWCLRGQLAGWAEGVLRVFKAMDLVALHRRGGQA